ncbi:MAG: hypothetical protein V4697_01895 [Patescibacteria group bacterium]
MDNYLCIGAICAIALLWYLYKHRGLDREEYLKVLSFTAWKDIDQIKRELENKEDILLNPVEIQQAMLPLQREGLVEQMMLPRLLLNEGPVICYKRKWDSDWSERNVHPRDPSLPRRRFDLDLQPA